MQRNGMLFLDDNLRDVLDEHRYRAIDVEKGLVSYIGRPRVQFDGTVQHIEMVLEVKEFKIVHRMHPLEPVENRPTSGRCYLSVDKQCSDRKFDIQGNSFCTEDPLNESCCYKTHDSE